MMTLTVQLADPIRRPHGDGTGYDVRNAYNGHNIGLKIGNVSIAFDGRDVWSALEGETCHDTVMQFAEYRDDPVRLDGVSRSKCHDVAETILRALAADLGYTVSK